MCCLSLCSIVQYAKDSIRGIASADMHVCATFSRRFYWSDLNLWPEDLPKGSVVMLSGKDDLMDSAEVKEMLDIAGHVKVRAAGWGPGSYCLLCWGAVPLPGLYMEVSFSCIQAKQKWDW